MAIRVAIGIGIQMMVRFNLPFTMSGGMTSRRVDCGETPGQ
jgi:hypothetical protein